MSLTPFDLEAWDEANGLDPSPAGPAPQRGAAGPPWGDRFSRGDQTEARAVAWLAAVPGAVAGQSGSNQALKAAMVGPAFDLSPGETLALLAAEYNPRCVPEWSEAELAHKVESAFDRETRRGWLLEVDRNPAPSPGGGKPPGRKRPPGGAPPPSEGPPPPADEDEGDEPDDSARREGWQDNPHALARIFRGDNYQHADGWMIRYWMDQFHAWNRGAYRPIRESDMRAKLAEAVSEEFERDYATQVVRFEMSKLPEDKPRPIPVTKGCIANVMQALEGLSLVDSDTHPNQPSWIDNEEGWNPAECVPMRNAIVHLPSFAAGLPCTRKPTPRFFCPYVLNYDFDPDAPAPARFLAFLASVFPDDKQSIETLQEWIGLQLVPELKYEKIMALIGPPRAGKGTISEVISALVGPENCAGPTLSSLSDKFGLKPLIGKLSAIIDDARLSSKSDQAVITERLLSISGAGRITCDRKYRDDWTGKLPCRITLISNELPRLADASSALPNRFIVLRFTQSFLGKEDLSLKSDLLKELSGIFLWAVEGWKRLRERGYFVQPESGLDDARSMRAIASPISSFVEECGIVDPDERAPVADSYRAWRAWCESNGIKEAGTKEVFSRNLRSVIPKLKTVARRTPEGWDRDLLGFGLKPPISLTLISAPATAEAEQDAQTGWDFSGANPAF